MSKEGYKFSKEQLDKARDVDLGAYLMQTDPDRFYKDEHGYIRDLQREKFKVDTKRNKYFMNQNVENAIGNPIEYLDKIVGMGFVRAVETLLAFENSNSKKRSEQEIHVRETNLYDDDAFAYYEKMIASEVEYQEMYDEC